MLSTGGLLLLSNGELVVRNSMEILKTGHATGEG